MRGLSKLSGFVGWIALAVDLAFNPSSDLAPRGHLLPQGEKGHDTMDRHATVEPSMPPALLDDLPDDLADALAEARLRLRNSLIEGVISVPTNPVGPEYFESLRKRLGGE